MTTYFKPFSNPLLIMYGWTTSLHVVQRTVLYWSHQVNKDLSNVTSHVLWRFLSVLVFNQTATFHTPDLFNRAKTLIPGILHLIVDSYCSRVNLFLQPVKLNL